MIKKSAKINAGEIYEHLEHYFKKTTYTDRWRWLKEANAFVDAVEKQRKKGKLFVVKKIESRR